MLLRLRLRRGLRRELCKRRRDGQRQPKTQRGEDRAEAEYEGAGDLHELILSGFWKLRRAQQARQRSV